MVALDNSEGGPEATPSGETRLPVPANTAGDRWGPSRGGRWGPDSCCTWHLRRGLQQCHLCGGLE
uniref:R3H domain containing 4 n=1 Tax=Mus musculus TaxID=10090 RepID=A0A1W2P823_MOUSE